MNLKILSSFRIHLLLAIALTASSLTAGAALTFPTESNFASGRWVKVDFETSGIYEITYDELREMGFSDPSKVGVFGNGGVLQPTQFVDASGNQLYSPTLTPVAVLHSADKIIFYGAGPADLRQCTENVAYPSRKQFEQVSLNTFAAHASYYLTDSRDIYTPTRGTGKLNTQRPLYSQAWTVDYHELEANAPVATSRQSFGEELKQAGSVSFPYSLPGTAAGSDVYVDLHVAHYPSGVATATGTFVADGTSTSGSTTLGSLADRQNFAYASMPYFRTTLPGAEGTFTVAHSGGSSWAYLDYYILAAKRDLKFADDESSIVVYASDYDSDTYSMIYFTNSPEDIVVWDIASPSDVRWLPFDRSLDMVYARYLRPGKESGVMAAFSPSRTQLKVSGWSEVAATDLFSLGLDEVPDMLIITLPDFAQAAQRIANLHSAHEGLTTAIVYSQDVINEFSAGVPDPMAYRALIKMIYDRDNASSRRFKNVLLLGPCLRDYRGLGATSSYGSLIPNESYNSLFLDDAFLLNDWYCMMDDRTEYELTDKSDKLAEVPMHLGLGIIPANTPAEAMTYIQKVEEFYSDSTLAYWLNEGNYVADSADNNEHQNQMNALHTEMMQLTGRSFSGVKLFNNLYGNRGTTAAFKSRFNDGTMLSYYLGHSDPTNLSGEFWGLYDDSSLSNSRYGFMTFASCTVTDFDNAQRGLGERLVMLPSKGIVAGLMSNRNNFSYSNYVVSSTFQRACVLEDAAQDADSPLLSAPRTLGETYMLAKNAYQNNSNKFSYHLIGDPAITLPLPTATIDLELKGSSVDGVEVYPHEQMEISGRVLDRDGNLLSGFSGPVVAKVFNPPYTRPTVPRKGASVVDVEIDETPVSIVTFNAEGGTFSGTLTLPSTIAPSTDDKLGVIRVAAYDPSTRRGASGARLLDVQEYDEQHAVAQDNAPVIEALYVNSPDLAEGSSVAPSFTLYADVTDDIGVMSADVGGFSSLLLTVDGNKGVGNLARYFTLTDNGRRCRLAYPMSGLTYGVHTLQLEVADAEGQRTRRSISVRVANPELTGVLATADEPARESVTFTYTPTSSAELPSLTLVVLDAAGRQVACLPMDSATYEWDLIGADGTRVTPGIYQALCRMSNDALGQGATTPVRFVVF